MTERGKRRFWYELGKALIEGKLLRAARLLWPNSYFYDKEEEIFLSVEENDQTFVYAGNMLGKDYTASRIVLTYSLHPEPTRAVTTSVADEHLDVLWDEMNSAMDECIVPLRVQDGGPFRVTHRSIRKVVNGVRCPISSIRGVVWKKGEKISGRHAPRNLLIGDEASGLDDELYTQGQRWAGKMLFIGNCNECENFYRETYEKGDQPREYGGYYRKKIHIAAEDSPNVKFALAQQKAGIPVTNEVLVPGVIRYRDGVKGYEYRRKFWGEMDQCVSLDGKFWEGQEVKMYPKEWRELAYENYRRNKARKRIVKAMGIDTGEGVANTSWWLVDEYGVIYWESFQTKDTNVIPKHTKDLARKFNVPPTRWIFDRGGGGLEHADRLRGEGYACRTVGFGERPSLPKRRGLRSFKEKEEYEEERYHYFNMRAQMYGTLRNLINPLLRKDFGIPDDYRLRQQMRPIPYTKDQEGRIYILPKTKKDPTSREKCLIDLIGYSPDDLDALVLAIYGMTHKATSKSYAGVG